MRVAVAALFVSLVASLCVTNVGAEEPSELATGLVLEDEVSYGAIPEAEPPFAGELPARKDLSASFPTPGHQGRQGSCVGWALAHGLKSYLACIAKRGCDPFSPSYVYNQIRLDKTSCKEGSRFSHGFQLLENQGAIRTQDFPYDPKSCSRMPTEAEKSLASAFRISGWTKLDRITASEVKGQIATGVPVVFGMPVDAAFEALKKGAVYSTPAVPGSDYHAMVAVGYDDEKAAFKALNSWGANWSSDGFAWISYKVFESTVRQAFTAEDEAAVAVVACPLAEVPAERRIVLGRPTATLGTSVAGQEGVGVEVVGQVWGAKGQTIRITIRFRTPRGAYFVARRGDVAHRDDDGYLVLRQDFVVPTDRYDLRQLPPMVLAYRDLNLAPGRRPTQQRTVRFRAHASFVVDGKPQAGNRSPWSEFTLPW